MFMRFAGLLVFIAGTFLIIAGFWDIPYSRPITIICSVICGAFGIYELLRAPAKKAGDE